MPALTHTVGIDKTADNVNKARCILHPPLGYKDIQSMLKKIVENSKADENCLFRFWIMKFYLIQCIKDNLLAIYFNS